LSQVRGSLPALIQVMLFRGQEILPQLALGCGKLGCGAYPACAGRNRGNTHWWPDLNGGFRPMSDIYFEVDQSSNINYVYSFFILCLIQCFLATPNTPDHPPEGH
jgi:hypothetical protein